MPEPVKFRGTVTYERYYAEDSFYGVYIVKTTDNIEYGQFVDKPDIFEDAEDFEPYNVVTIVGKVQRLYVGSEYEFICNPKYSEKYNTHQYEPISVIAKAPMSQATSRLFLSSILSERQADVLLEAYPNIIQEIIDGKDNVDVNKLYGIGSKSYDKIKERIINNYVMSDIVTLLQPLGVSMTAIRALLRWESNASILRQKINDNPYDLIAVRGFGFKKVDQLALKLDPELINSNKRLLAYMRYNLNRAAEEEGHTWILKTTLVNGIIDEIPQCKALFDDLLGQTQDGVFAGYFIVSNDKIGLKRYHDCEESIYAILKDLNHYYFKGKIDVEAGIAKAEKQLGYELSEEQRSVVRKIDKSNVVVYTGFSGSGKTSTAKAILNSFQRASIACCSLSAKAAQRIQEATGFKASTIHRLLG